MITGKRDTVEDSRAGYALALLESSGYGEEWRNLLAIKINDSSADEVELIIQDLLMNQVDKWSSYRNKDIQRRLNKHDT